MGLLKAFKENIDGQHLFHPKDTLLLAVSGGVDSVVLCALCKLAGYSFAIAHCNFQLRGEDSKRDEAFVRQMASNYKVDFFCKTFDTLAESRKQKKSIEETARNLRYEWFNELLHSLTGSQELKTKNEALKSYSFLLTAHHADDNIETVLMNFFRGTGLAGLHGILPRQQRIIRPLLFAFKTELEAFAAENKLDLIAPMTRMILQGIILEMKFFPK
jgi:tRNA(Ile)-lysidine synthase